MFEYTSSGLNTAGDTITLLDGTPVVINSVAYGTASESVVTAAGTDQSAYRTTDGGSIWALTGTPTKGTTNTNSSLVKDTTTGIYYSNLQAAINGASAVDTLSINADLTTTSEVTVNKSVTINGNDHTISPNFLKTDNSNNVTIGIVSDNVTINNLIEDGTKGTNLHGINVYASTGVNLNSVTVKIIITTVSSSMVLPLLSTTSKHLTTHGVVSMLTKAVGSHSQRFEYIFNFT